MRGWLRLLWVVSIPFVLAACTEVQFATQAAKSIAGPSPTAAAAAVTTPVARYSPQGVPIGDGGVYKVGNPYVIDGVTYHPREEPNYDETGIASWYGDQFHAKLTANGETYDMNSVTAAHKTLPLPSYVQVTNLDNGRSLVVRVNDRGPYVNGRIIDLSRRSAQLLGMDRAGVAKVRVKVISPPDGTFMVAGKPVTEPEHQMATAVPVAAVESTALPPPPGTRQEAPRERFEPPAQVALQAVGPSNIYIQAGAFSRYDNASNLGNKLAGFGAVRITPTKVRGADLYRVRIGPMTSVQEADTTLTRVIGSGLTDARIVVD